MYFDGNGVEKDINEAYAWFKLAARAEFEQAILNVSVIEANLNEEEMAAATAKAEDYLAKYPSEK